jgi:dipeptidyl-peptidase 4
MKIRAIIITSILLSISAAFSLPLQGQDNALTLENIYTKRAFRSKGFGPVRWMKDSKGYSTVSRESVRCWYRQSN